jgi:hypothetical protein
MNHNRFRFLKSSLADQVAAFLVIWQMADKRWITSGARRLSTEHLKGVEEFMQHVCTVFAKDVAILCPCCEYLNHYQLPQGTVEDHLLLRGMANT